MTNRTLTVITRSFVVAVIAGCATAKDKLGVSYELHRPDREIAEKTPDGWGDIEPGKVYCRPVSYYSWSSVVCGAFIEVELARIFATLRNPYFTSGISSPLVPKADSGQRDVKNPMLFRYQACYDATESIWGYAFGNSGGSYVGIYHPYKGTGRIHWIQPWDLVEWLFMTSQYGTHTEGEWIEGVYLEKMEFKVYPRTVGGRQGAFLSVALSFHGSHPFSCNCPEHDNAEQLVETGLNNLRATAVELVEAVAAIGRMLGGAKADLSIEERESLLPLEFLEWESRSLAAE